MLQRRRAFTGRSVGRRRALGVVVTMTAAVALSASLAAASGEQPFPTQLVRVNVPTQDDRDRLTNLGLDLTEHGGPTYVEVVLHNAADAAELAASGFVWVVTIPDLAVRQKQNNEVSAAYASATELSPLPSGRDTYRTLAEYNSDLRNLAALRPGLVKLLALSRRSLEGREILGVEISDNVASQSDGKPVFLLMGLHHAREWPSGEHAIEFAYDLVKNYGSKGRITDLLKKSRVLVVPVVNVDGFEQSRKWGDLVDVREVDNGGQVSILGNPGNAYKRKNCRVVDGQSTPQGGCEVTSPGGYGIGVDLNRNYGGLWGGAGASDVAADPTYRGPGAFSEPETQAVRELISSRQVTTLITNHTFSNLVLRPPGIRAAGETVDETAMKDLGGRMAAQNGAVLRLTKEFKTSTSQSGFINDRLVTTLVVPGGNKYTWHVNPSTRPEVMEHRVRILAGSPSRQQVFNWTGVWSIGDQVDLELQMPETDVGVLKVNLDWPTPDDLDLVAYYRQPDGSLLEVGSSGEFVLSKEEAIMELPDPGTYVLRAVNYASTTPSFTMTAGLYGIAGEDSFGGNVVESYKLTCEKPDGTVLQTASVAVDRGKSKRVDLNDCVKKLKG